MDFQLLRLSFYHRNILYTKWRKNIYSTLETMVHFKSAQWLKLSTTLPLMWAIYFPRNQEDTKHCLCMQTHHGSAVVAHGTSANLGMCRYCNYQVQSNIINLNWGHRNEEDVFVKCFARANNRFLKSASDEHTIPILCANVHTFTSVLFISNY